MIQCFAQREMMHEKGFIKNPFLRPLGATVTEAETCQLCWTTGTSPSWRVCLYCGGSDGLQYGLSHLYGFSMYHVQKLYPMFTKDCKLPVLYYGKGSRVGIWKSTQDIMHHFAWQKLLLLEVLPTFASQWVAAQRAQSGSRFLGTHEGPSPRRRKVHPSQWMQQWQETSCSSPKQWWKELIASFKWPWDSSSRSMTWWWPQIWHKKDPLESIQLSQLQSALE